MMVRPSLLMLAVLLTARPVLAQQVRGRVVDERQRQAVVGVTVVLLDAEGGVRAEAETDGTGFFVLRPASAGAYTLVVVQPGYGEHRQAIEVGTAEKLIPAIVLKVQAVELDPLEVEARARREAAEAAPGFQRGSHVVAPERMAVLERQGARMVTVARELSTLRIREWTDRTGRSRLCVESRRAAPTGLQIGGGGPECHWVALVVDGIPLGGGEESTFRQFQVSDYESVEYVPPAEAARLYGMDAGVTGALVLWSRGRGPHASPAREVR